MADSATLQVDVAILGGGIAGLWLLARLRQAGYSTLLLESQALGAGQTIASQGIIHGGLKYAIDLKLGGASAPALMEPVRSTCARQKSQPSGIFSGHASRWSAA
jgi:glycerol-3-phosphate dehydrogenase